MQADDYDPQDEMGDAHTVDTTSLHVSEPTVAHPPGETPTTGPKGLGGWLVLPILGLFITIIFSVVILYQDLIPVMEPGTWSQFTAPGVHSMWVPLFVFETFCIVVQAIAAVALLVILFRRLRILPTLIIWFYAFVFVYVFIESVLILIFGPDMVPNVYLREQVGWTTTGIVGGLMRALIPTAIWIPYFMVSKRVQNTFVNPLAGAAAPQRPLAPMETSVSPVVRSVPSTAAASRSPSRRRPWRIVLWVLGAILIIVIVLGIIGWVLEETDPSSDDVGGRSSVATVTRVLSTPGPLRMPDVTPHACRAPVRLQHPGRPGRHDLHQAGPLRRRGRDPALGARYGSPLRTRHR
jgi:hypothetical protein